MMMVSIDFTTAIVRVLLCYYAATRYCLVLLSTAAAIEC